MPNTSHAHHTSSSGDDLSSIDEVTIFEDEGDREDEKISSENLLEEKSSLIDLTESEEKSSKTATRSDHNLILNKVEPHASNFNVGYLASPRSYSNGTGGSSSNTINLQSLFGHTIEHLKIPSPAHCRIPPFQLDSKQIGLPKPAIYPFSSNQYPYTILNADISHVSSWRGPSMYSSTPSFRSPYCTSIPISSNLSSDFPFRFTPSIPPQVDISPYNIFNTHQNIIASSSKQETSASQRYFTNIDATNSKRFKDYKPEKKKMHIKKPLNAFMLYMKEMRAKVVAECKLKESAAINQILGRRWHELSREEQSKYYEKARQERQLHMELYPGYVLKNKKRKKDKCSSDIGVDNVKKC